VDVLLINSFIHIAFLRNNYMFRPGKRPKHVVVPKIGYVNKAA